MYPVCRESAGRCRERSLEFGGPVTLGMLSCCRSAAALSPFQPCLPLLLFTKTSMLTSHLFLRPCSLNFFYLYLQCPYFLQYFFNHLVKFKRNLQVWFEIYPSVTFSSKQSAGTSSFVLPRHIWSVSCYQNVCCRWNTACFLSSFKKSCL